MPYESMADVTPDSVAIRVRAVLEEKTPADVLDRLSEYNPYTGLILQGIERQDAEIEAIVAERIKAREDEIMAMAFVIKKLRCTHPNVGGGYPDATCPDCGYFFKAVWL